MAVWAESEISISLDEQRHNYIPLIWVDIHCESKMEKRDLKPGKSWRENSKALKKQMVLGTLNISWKCFISRTPKTKVFELLNTNIL